MIANNKSVLDKINGINNLYSIKAVHSLPEFVFHSVNVVANIADDIMIEISVKVADNNNVIPIIVFFI